MLNGLTAMLRKVFGLFVDDGSMALSLLAWIFALRVATPFVSMDHGWAAPVLFLGCAAILIENVLRASRRRPAYAKVDKDNGES